MVVQDNAHTEMPLAGAGLQLAEAVLGEQTPAKVEAGFPKAGDGWLAYVLTNVGSPPVLAPAAMVLTAAVLAEPSAWMWAGLYVLVTVVTPLLYLVWLKHRGLIADLDVQRREQRTRPMIFTLACGGLAWLVLLAGAAPMQMTLLAGLLWLQMVVILCITLRWKISVHCATAAGAATVACALLGTPLPLLAVPIIAWSRVRLRRHTLAQTIAGSLLGFGLFAIVLSLAYGR
jgi:membrane-associated phospholipid phosphatase